MKTARSRKNTIKIISATAIKSQTKNLDSIKNKEEEEEDGKKATTMMEKTRQTIGTRLQLSLWLLLFLRFSSSLSWNKCVSSILPTECEQQGDHETEIWCLFYAYFQML